VKLYVTMREYAEITERCRDVQAWRGHPQGFCRGELPFVLWALERFGIGPGTYDVVVREGT
jgi:hypothetical protein